MTVLFPGRMPASDITHLDDLAYSYFTPEGDEESCSWGPQTSFALQRIKMPLGKNESVNFSSKKLPALVSLPYLSTGTRVKVNLEIQVSGVLVQDSNFTKNSNS